MPTPLPVRRRWSSRRILIGLTALAVFGGSAAAQTVSTQSEAFVLKPKRAAPPSVIRILQPPVMEGVATVVTDSVLQMRGQYAGAGTLLGGSVNETPVTIGTGGRFECTRLLKRGLNDVQVTLRIAGAQTYTRALGVIYDTEPPTIIVLEPEQEDLRGVRLLAPETGRLRLKIFDESGVRAVTIDGVSVPVRPDSTVSREFARFRGESIALVVATDNAGRTIEKRVRAEFAGESAGLEFRQWKSHALIIGVDKYSGEWAPLQNAVRDAKALESVLRQQFRFASIRTLYDKEATRANILTSIESLAEELGPEENLLLYYSGHGDRKEQFNAGYWVPVDADKRMTAQYVANTDIIGLIGGMRARHVLVVADACFAGELVRGRVERQPLNKTVDFYQNEARRRSRKAFTSGAKEPVLDGGREGHSIFAYYFLQALREIDGQYFDVSDVFGRVRTAVGVNARQMPLYDPLWGTGDEGGEFIFVRK